MRGFLMALVGLTGCYDPRVPAGAPCASDDACPRGQACDLTTRICGGVSTEIDAAVDGPPRGDAPADGASLTWIPAVLNVPGSNGDEDPTMSSDRLLLVFVRHVGQNLQLYQTTRATPASPWAAPTAVAELDVAPQVTSPELSPDGLTMFFTLGTATARDVYVATRANRASLWTAVAPVQNLSTTSDDVGIGIRPDGLFAVADNDSSGDRDLYTSQRVGNQWTSLVAASGMSVPGRAEGSPTVATDGTVYFHVNTGGLFDVWKGTPNASGGYTATAVPELAGYSDPFLLPDGTLLLCAKGGKIWGATR